MMPPISGKQASAAATLDGRPVEVGRAVASDWLSGGGVGAAGSIGSTGSGMPVFTKAVASEQALLRGRFGFHKTAGG